MNLNSHFTPERAKLQRSLVNFLRHAANKSQSQYFKKDYLSPNAVHFILHHTLARHQTKKIGKGVQRE